MKKVKIVQSIFLTIGLFVVLGCVSAVSAQDTVSYKCGSTPLTVTYMSGGDSVKINFSATNATLNRAESGSGAKYTGKSDSGDVTFWTQGKEAQLTIGSGFDGKCRETGSKPMADSSTGDVVNYMCSQTPMTATFMNNGSKVQINFSSTNTTLKRVKSGSGAKYTGKSDSGNVTFWTQGKEAMLTIGSGFNGKCVEQ